MLYTETKTQPKLNFFTKIDSSKLKTKSNSVTSNLSVGKSDSSNKNTKYILKNDIRKKTLVSRDKNK